MKINIKGTGMELTPAITNYVQKKLSLVDKYVEKGNTDVMAQVEVGKSTKHHKTGEVFRAEVHLSGGGLDLYAVSEQADLYAAIDVVKDEITHNLVQLKGKNQTLSRKGAQLVKNMMKGLSERTTRGFSWSVKRFRFKKRQ